MTDQARTDDDEVVTKGYLREYLQGYLREEFQKFRIEFGAELRSEFRSEMGAMKREILYELGHATQVIVEQFATHVAAFDDKYAPLQPRVGSLERAFEEHRTDYTAHKRPRPPRK